MGEPLDDCPFKDYRKLTIVNQFSAAEFIEYELLNSILFYHDVCLSFRESY
jgi:hypothetical protein